MIPELSLNLLIIKRNLMDLYMWLFFFFLKVLLTIGVLFHEKGDKNDISNYRPLAEFTNTKIFQSLIQISLNNVCKYVLSRNQQRI